MQALAIEHDVGKELDLIGRRALRFFAGEYGATVAEIDPKAPTRVDGIIIKNGEIIAVAECRSRGRPYEFFVKEKTMLVTKAKIDASARIAAELGAPYFLVTVLRESPVLLWWRMSDAKGNLLVNITNKWTWTRTSSIDPTMILRMNSFIALSSGNIINFSDAQHRDILGVNNLLIVKQK